MTAARASITAVAAVVGAALGVILLTTWAASIGPDRVLAGEGPAANPMPPPSVSLPTGVDPMTGLDRIRADAKPESHPALLVVARALEIAVALVLLYLLYRAARWLREAWDARPRPEPPAQEVDFDVLTAPGAMSDAILDDADEQRLLLAEGTGGGAIVECWHRFEAQAATIGTTRRPSETSSEFTLRVLDLASADGPAVARLAGLYREARFSEHAMTEDDRVAAIAALDVIHDGLRATRRGGVR